MHEGVDVLTWNTDEHGYGGCDRLLWHLSNLVSPPILLSNRLDAATLIFLDLGDVGDEGLGERHSRTYSDRNDAEGLGERHSRTYSDRNDTPWDTPAECA